MQYKIMFVDDEAANLRLLERLFRNTHDVLTATSGAQALEMLETHDVALIISDQRMPEMKGSDFLKAAAELRPQTVRMILTGYTDVGDLVEAINSGVVYRYITKPWINEELQQTVKRSLQHYETMKAQRQLQLHNERLQSRLKTMRDSYVDTLLTLLEERRPGSLRHAERTAETASAIGESLRLERLDVEQVALAARLHEVALLHVSGNTAPGRIDPAGITSISEEIGRGLDLLDSAGLEDVADVLRYQFERPDGSGAPYGFAGDQIPLASRIVSAATYYEDLIGPRDGFPAVAEDAALESLRRQAGSRFDAAVVDCLSRLKEPNFSTELMGELLVL
jgi:adenylate cyclase